MANLNYSTVITNAITAFDNIYNSLKAKSVAKDAQGTLLPNVENSGIPVSNYPDFISNQLFRVSGVLSSSGVVSSAGVIANYSGSSIGALSGTPVYVDSTESGVRNITASGTGLSGGYYSTTSTISLTIPGSTFNISGTISSGNNWEVGDSQLTYTPASTVVTKIIINKASLSFSVADITQNNMTTDISTEISTALTGVTLTTPTTLTDYSSFDLGISSSTTGSLAVTSTVHMDSAGYLNGFSGDDPETQTASKSGTISETGSETQKVYIKNAKITNLTGSSSVSTSIPTDIKTDSTSDNAYTITSSVPNIDISGSVEAGYLASTATVTGSATVSPSTTYIHKGTVSNTTKAVEFKTTVGTGLSVDSTDSDAYAISVDLNSTSKSATGVIDPGYVKETSYSVSLTSTEQTFKIPKGSATVSAGTPTLTLTPSSSVLLTTDKPTGSYYTISSAVSSALAASPFKAGYFKDTGSLTLSGLSSAASTVYYIPKASATYTPKIEYTLTNADDSLDPNSGTAESPVYIFSSTAPESGDYYTITSSIDQSSLTEGYLVSNGITYSGTKSYYLPKAVFTYVENSESGNYVQVSTGGYIPSGILKDIANIGSTPDLAVVNVSFVNPSGASLIHTTKNTGDYTINLAKGTVDSGYISSSEGTLTGVGYISHGSVNSAVSLTGLSADENPTWNSTTSKYEIGIRATPSVTSTTTVEGFIKSSDVTITPDTEKTGIISLAKAILTAETQDTEGSTIVPLTASGVGVTSGASTSSYYIEYNVASGAKARARVSTTGYIESGAVSDDVTLTNAASKFYLNHAALSSPDSTNAKVASYTTNFSTTQTGDYTITATLSGSASASVSEGYVPSAGLSDVIGLSGTDSSIKVAHGAISTSVTGSSSLTGSGTTVEGTNYLLSAIPTNESASSYVSLTSTAIGTETGTITAGYIKQADFSSNAESKTLGTLTKYIRLFTNNVITAEDEVSKKLNTYTIASVSSDTAYTSGSATVLTAGTFSQNNLKVTIDDDSMGKNVYDKFIALNNRLNGVSA